MAENNLTVIANFVVCRRAYLASDGQVSGDQSWSRLSEQFFRFDKWSLCRG
jgi:hypothetical protein